MPTYVRRDPVRLALLLGAVVPALLLGSAISMQHALGLVPCHMCLQQRSALWAALALSAAGLMMRNPKARFVLTCSSAASVWACAWVATLQAGGERGLWKLELPCASTAAKGASLDDLLSAPIIRCDVPQWSFAGLTMADLDAAACVVLAISMTALAVRSAALAARTRRTAEQGRKA